MSRLKLLVFAALAIAGTAGAFLYAIAIAPGATTRLESAILFFTAAAAVMGYLGVLVGWLSYRLESGRVPKPDLAIISEGDLVRHWSLEIELLDPERDVSGEIQEERERMEAVIAKLRRSSGHTTGNAFMGAWMKQVSPDDIDAYSKRVEKYLDQYETYVRNRVLSETFWARSRRLVFAFTNERAGVPAEGVRAIVHIPTDDDLRLVEESKAPDMDEAPNPPNPPKARSIFDVSSIIPSSLLQAATLDRALGSLRDVKPQGNVSPPIIRKGSTIVEFSVKEVLHNLYDDSRHSPLVLLFNRAGTWTMPYEVHARNLPRPKNGTLTLSVGIRRHGSESPNAQETARGHHAPP